MLGQDKYLLVDIGNTSIKYALYSLKGGLSEVSAAQKPEELAGLIKDASKVLLSCVAKDEWVEHWRSLCQQQGTELFVAQTEAVTMGMHCAYENYQTLGVDRWLAILGAREVTTKPFAVIDIGTAMTCDIVLGQQHMGGWILPGFELMRSGLINNTAKVFSDNSYPSELSLGTDTPACVNLGCLAAIQGVVKMASEILNQYSEEFDILVTGGGQHLLQDMNKPPIRFAENLVLSGLCLFIDHKSFQSRN